MITIRRKKAAGLLAKLVGPDVSEPGDTGSGQARVQGGQIAHPPDVHRGCAVAG